MSLMSDLFFLVLCSISGMSAIILGLMTFVLSYLFIGTWFDKGWRARTRTVIIVVTGVLMAWGFFLTGLATYGAWWFAQYLG